mmetsp:Transcript_27606/g.62624  ORF Transcript_27606/g.62624 Transcript_27606/m.62624 type:complete len:206 (+) Transcript_27606:208-825(+)
MQPIMLLQAGACTETTPNNPRIHFHLQDTFLFLLSAGVDTHDVQGQSAVNLDLPVLGRTRNFPSPQTSDDKTSPADDQRWCGDPQSLRSSSVADHQQDRKPDDPGRQAMDMKELLLAVDNQLLLDSIVCFVGERRKPPSNIGVRDRDGDGDFLRHAVLQHAHAQSHALHGQRVRPEQRMDPVAFQGCVSYPQVDCRIDEEDQLQD